MIFNSAVFLLFISLVVTINYFLPSSKRPIFVLFSGFLFIAYFNLESLLAVVVFTVFNFYIARNIAENRLLYLLGLLINGYAIIMFNYFNWTKAGLEFSYSYISFNIESFIIALGLSYYSLQNIAYITEVYFKRLKPETSILNFALYNSFFPKVISGPVMLPKEFIPQITKNDITSEKLIRGFHRFLFGLFKKMVIADRLSPAVHSIFDFGDTNSGLTTVMGVYLFTIQLYFDFSGYTDMALGVSKMLGYDLKENFNLPLRSTSIAEFWRRWHISLISWFTNYIYYPVVYRLRAYKKRAAFIGILATFLISGIWHGIGFTFLAWAACHVLYLSFELLFKKKQLSERWNGSIFKVFAAFIVFNAVCFSNIFFRSSSIENAMQLIKNSASNFFPQNWLRDFVAPLAVGGHQIDEFNFYLSIFMVGTFLLFERKLNTIANLEKINIVFVSLFVLLIFLFGVFNNGERFIYMQF